MLLENNSLMIMFKDIVLALCHIYKKNKASEIIPLTSYTIFIMKVVLTGGTEFTYKF